MRFITDCAACGSVVLPAAELRLVPQPTGDYHGVFTCPVCDDTRAVPVARVSAPALVARGAAVGTLTRPEPAPLTLDDLAALQTLLADDQGCRRLLGEAT